MSAKSNSKPCSTQCLRASLFILVLVSSLLTCVEGRSFEVSGPGQSQKAVVDSSKTLDVEFDPPLANVNYDSSTKFLFTVGGCNLDVSVLQASDGILLYVESGNVKTDSAPKNPSGFKVSSSGIKFEKIAQSFCSSGVDFEEHPSEKNKYLLEIKIGSSAPPGFGLRSGSDLYEPSENTEVFGMSIPNWVLYVSIAVLVLLLIALFASGACYIVIRNKKRKQILEEEAKALKTAISAESKSKNTTSEDQKASKDKEEKASKNDPKLDKPKKAKQEKPVLKQIALKAEQKPKDPLEQDEKEGLIDN